MADVGYKLGPLASVVDNFKGPSQLQSFLWDLPTPLLGLLSSSTHPFVQSCSIQFLAGITPVGTPNTYLAY